MVIAFLRTIHLLVVLLWLGVLCSELFGQLVSLFVKGYFYRWNTFEANVGTVLVVVGFFNLLAIAYYATVAYSGSSPRLILSLHLSWLVVFTAVGWFIFPRFINPQPWEPVAPETQRAAIIGRVILYSLMIGCFGLLPALKLKERAREATPRQFWVLSPKITTTMIVCSVVLWVIGAVRFFRYPADQALVGAASAAFVTGYIVALALAAVPAIAQRRSALVVALLEVVSLPVTDLLRTYL